MNTYTPVYRVQLVRERRQQISDRSVRNANDAAEIVRSLIGDADREMFVVAGLSVKNELIGLHIVSIGALDLTIVHPREV